MWKGYNVQRGKLSDAFKQYLRDRGLYFEPSENGTYIHFEVKNADESVDRFLKTIDSIIHDSCPIGDDTPKNKNEIALYIGTFDIEKQDTKWKKIQTFKKLKEGYIAFKDLCKKCVGYTYEELLEIYNSPRLDIELMQGDKKLKWMGVYEKELEEEDEESEQETETE